MSIAIAKNHMAEMNMLGMLAVLDKTLAHATRDKISYSEFVDILLQAEADYRQERKTVNRIKAAKFTVRPAFEDFDFTAKRSITKAEIKEIYTLGWLNDARPLLLIGETGVGKTFIAQAVGLHACASGKSVLYMSITALQENLAIARSSGTYLRYRAKLAKFDLIIFDEMAMRKFTATEAQDLCEIIEERSIDKSIDRFYFPTPRGPLERSHPRCRHLRRHPGPPGTLGAHRQHHRRHLSRGQSQKTCLKEKGRVEL